VHVEGIPGDSGSAFLDVNGTTLGTLSTLELAPTPASNGVVDLADELAYLHSNSSFGNVNPVPGTESFRGPLAPLP
jgi:hypothetical protein